MADSAVVRAICEEVSGDMLAREACAKHGISTVTLWRWTESDSELGNLYTRARVSQAHSLAEQCISIADGTDTEAQLRAASIVAEAATVDEEERESVMRALHANAIQRDRLRLDARKWYTSKIAPKIYGDKLQTEVTGADGGPVEVRVRIVREGRRVTAS